MSEQYGGAAGPPEPERPGPYQGPGIFGPGAAPGPGSGGQPGAYQPGSPQPGGNQPGGHQGGGNGPGGYGPGGAPGPGPARPPVYGWQQPSTPPRQVTVASTIALILGGLLIILGLMTMTSAGAQVAETMAGTADAQGLMVVVILVGAVAYILPAVFLRKRRPWARIMLIVVAAFGVVGGLLSLPASIIGLALHIGLLVMMFQQPTKDWFLTARR